MWNKVFAANRRYCDGITRRQMLRVGGAGLLGGLTLPGKVPFRQ